jgi:hypothetical protein
MSDPRFLPLEKREPFEESDDDFLEESDEEMDEILASFPRGKKQMGNSTLFVAS